jgi:cell envelope opacity-associated protein A
MEKASPGIFSVQAVLISLALHVVVVGGLFSLGRSDSEPATESEKITAKENSAVKEEASEKSPTSEKPLEKVQEPLVRQEILADKKPVEIKMEPRKPGSAKADEPKKESAGGEAKKNESPKESDAKVNTKVYVVKSGDTLTALARDCGLTISELAALNGTSVKKLSNLKVGQRLKIVSK